MAAAFAIGRLSTGNLKAKRSEQTVMFYSHPKCKPFSGASFGVPANPLQLANSLQLTRKGRDIIFIYI
jgi:hypothetical protein